MTSTLSTAYGLVFQSQLPLPEFLPAESGAGDSQKPDVSIRLGTVPEHLDNAAGTGVLFEASPHEFLLRVPDIASYLVRNGNEILVEPAAGASDHEVRVFMLGSGLGALLHQRGVLVIHAAAIGGESGAFLFAGNSGVGKSTLLGELLSRGHSMMVDDVCAVEQPEGHDPVITPGYPRTRLWADSAARLEIDTDNLERTRPTLEKFEMQLPDRFWSRPAPLRRIYTLWTNNDSEPSLELLPKVDSFAMVLQNTYRRRFMAEMQMGAAHFALASELAKQIPIVRVTRPKGGFQLDELADLIEADMRASAGGS